MYPVISDGGCEVTAKGRGRMDIAVLYVEDEALMRQVLVEVLATRTRRVYQAANGEEGLELFKQHQPDVVIIDNNMPSMDGLSLARALQSITPSLPIILVSGDINRKNLLQVERMQLHFIKKPIRSANCCNCSNSSLSASIRQFSHHHLPCFLSLFEL